MPQDLSQFVVDTVCWDTPVPKLLDEENIASRYYFSKEKIKTIFFCKANSNSASKRSRRPEVIKASTDI